MVVGAVLYFLVFKKTEDPYDITGSWNISLNYFNTWSGTATFWGSLTSGQCRIGATPYSGLYTVNGAVVEFDDGDPGNTWHYRGNFTSLTAMNGTMYNASWTQIGTWTAIKNSVARRANSKYKARSLQGFKNNNRKPSKKKKMITEPRE